MQRFITRVVLLGWALLGVIASGAVMLPRLIGETVCVELTATVNASARQPFIMDTRRGFVVADPRQNQWPFGWFSPTQTDAYLTARTTNPVQHLYALYSHTPAQPDGALLEAETIFQTYFEQADQRIRWSADASRIAYIWQTATGEMQFAIANADGTNRRSHAIPTPPLPTPLLQAIVQNWSADGRYISTITRHLNATLYTFWDTETVQPISTGLENQSLVRGTWSPAGNRYAALLENERQQITHLLIWEMGEVVQRISLPEWDIQHLAWSPTGEHLVIGYRGVMDRNARTPTIWRFAIYQRTGNMVVNNLAGTVNNVPVFNTGTFLAPSGDVFIRSFGFEWSGLYLNAVWSSDGRHFTYLYSHPQPNRPQIDLMTFDSLTGKTRMLLSHIAPEFKEGIFYLMLGSMINNRSLESIAMAAQEDRLLIPYRIGEKFQIIHTNAAWENPIVLVEEADEIIDPIVDYSITSAFWASDLVSAGQFAAVAWADQQSRRHLSLISFDGRQRLDIPEEFLQIYSYRFVGEDWLGFTAHNGNTVEVYLYDLRDVQLYIAMSDIDPFTHWNVAFAPNRQYAAIIYSNRTIPELQLFEIASQKSVYLGGADFALPLWSSDSLKLAALSLGDAGRSLKVFEASGQLLHEWQLDGEFAAADRLINWTDCT